MTGIRTIFRTLLVTGIAGAMLAACSETSLPEATGKGTINMLNAMAASPDVGFLIEERFLGSVGFKATLGEQPFDDLSYNFNFEANLPGDGGIERIATHFIDMAADTNYTLVLTGSVTAPVITQWESPDRDWEGDETVFELGIAHLSPALGDVDVYVGLTGTAPVLGEERARLSYGEQMPLIDLEAENYEVIITARDDPATILHQSHDTFISARLTYLIGIFEAAPSITSNIAVRLISDAGLSSGLPDVNTQPTLRTVHAAFGTGNFDIIRGEDLTVPPIYTNLGFGESTGDLPVPEGIELYSYTDVGNIGVIINAESQLVSRGSRTTTVVTGLPGTELTRIIVNENRRSVESFPKFRVVHAAANFPALDLYLVDRGADITDLNPTLANLPWAFGNDFAAQTAGNFDLVLTMPGEKTIVAGPLMLDLADGDVTEAIFLDTVDPVVANIILNSF
jgi:hypothetical protein